MVGSSRITVDVADDALVVADPTRITQVLDNLVTNALRYGGPDVQVRAVREGAHVILTVSDDGPGIPEDLVDTLFDAYVHGRTSHGLGGSGLGPADRAPAVRGDERHDRVRRQPTAPRSRRPSPHSRRRRRSSTPTWPPATRSPSGTPTRTSPRA